MQGEPVTKKDGRALGITALALFAVLSIYFGQRWYEAREAKREATENALKATDIRDLRFWTAEETLHRLSVHENIAFLDLRSIESFEREHILDAEWLSPDILGSYSGLPGTVYVVVTEDTASPTLLREIARRLTERTLSFSMLQGGMKGWQEAGGKSISFGDPNSFLDQSKVTYLSPEAAEKLLPEGSGTLFLDVRDASAFRSGHLPGAQNIPLAELEKRRAEIPVGRPIIVYGNDELGGFQGAVRLFDTQYFGARVLEGGYAVWQEKKFPTEK